LSEDQITNLTPNERFEKLDRIANGPSPDMAAGAAAATSGLALVGALVLGRGRRGGGK